jgi:RNA polymerase sigma-70 factor, ECF subfamily
MPSESVICVMGAVEACVRKDLPRLLGIVTALCGSRDLAEDSLQEACARALEFEAKHGAVLDRPDAWLVTVAVNFSRSRWRKLRHEEPRASIEAKIVEVETEAEIDLRRAVRDLPVRQAQCVACFYWLDMPVAEIARCLQISEGTVKTALFRARANLSQVTVEK